MGTTRLAKMSKTSSCQTRSMIKAYKSKTRSHVPKSTRTVQVEELSAHKLFQVANKAQEKGKEALIKEYERKIALLTARAEAAEARADRENKRYHQTSAHLSEALIRAKTSEVRCDELENTQVSDVLKFILKNSNTACQKMTAVRPKN